MAPRAKRSIRCESIRLFGDGEEAVRVQCDGTRDHGGDHASRVTGKHWSGTMTFAGLSPREEVLRDALRFIVTKSSSVHAHTPRDRASIHNTAKAALMETGTLGDRSTWLTAAQDEEIAVLKEVLLDIRTKLPIAATKAHARIAMALGEE